MDKYIGQTVTIFLESDRSLTGTLESKDGHVYSVTNNYQHFVFWQREIISIINHNSHIIFIHHLAGF